MREGRIGNLDWDACDYCDRWEECDSGKVKEEYIIEHGEVFCVSFKEKEYDEEE